MAVWRLPIDRAHNIVGRAGDYVFVGSAGDFAADGRIRHAADLEAQIAGAVDNLEAALALEGCGLTDVIRLKAFYASGGGLDEWPVLAALLRRFSVDPCPAVTANPVPFQPFAGQSLQLQAIARRAWRALPRVRHVGRDIPPPHRSRFAAQQVTAGLRAGEFIAVPGCTAATDAAAPMPADGVAQTRSVMGRLGAILTALGAGFQDAIKMEGYYFGTSMDQWRPLAETRARAFREPGPVATVVPCHALWPAGAHTKIELLAMRDHWNGFDKYIPRDDRWPKRVWDWSIPLPYRQGIRLRDMIWTGGQVPFAPESNRGAPVYATELLPQTRYTMSYIDDILRAYGATNGDLALLVNYFASDGAAATTEAYLATLGECIAGPLPPLTIVPQPHMHSADMTVEIWGVARG